MIHFQLIHNTILWERDLEIEEEQRKHHRYEPVANHLSPIQRSRKTREYGRESPQAYDFLSILSAFGKMV